MSVKRIRCPDCDAAPGTAHENGCDVARCAVCGDQRIICPHADTDEGWGAVWLPEKETVETTEKMPSPREAIHALSCSPHRECRFGPGVQPGNQSVWCGRLDELLRLKDEQVLHHQAQVIMKFREVFAGAALSTLGPGLKEAANLTSPWTRIPAGEPRPAVMCPECAAGHGHYHRKADGSLVTTRTKEET